MPGSPSTQTTAPSPRARASVAARKTASSRRRPTHCGGCSIDHMLINGKLPPGSGTCRFWDWSGRSRSSAGSRIVIRPRSRVRARPTGGRATRLPFWPGRPRSSQWRVPEIGYAAWGRRLVGGLRGHGGGQLADPAHPLGGLMRVITELLHHLCRCSRGPPHAFMRSGARRSACGQAETVGCVEQQLLQLAWQVAVPHKARRGRQLTLNDANGNHSPGTFAGYRAWLCRYGLAPDAVRRACQHRGGGATRCREGEGHWHRLPERRVGEIETRIVRPQHFQPAIVCPATSTARAVDNVHVGQLIQADDPAGCRRVRVWDPHVRFEFSQVHHV